MGYTNTQRKYLAAGRCVGCGKERVGEGITKHRCAVCSEKNREICRAYKLRHPEKRNYPRDVAKRQAWAAKQREARSAAGLCVHCGKKRIRRGGTPTLCGSCAKNDREWSAAYRQRTRNRAAGYGEGDGRNVKIWPMGAASTGKREGGMYNFCLILDRDSLEALQVIRKRYKDGEWAAGSDPQTHQLSRLVREVILKYEPNRAVVKPRKHRLLVEMKANLSLDGRTKAILVRQAALRFGGNKSAALRAMLIECQGFRRAFTGSSLPKGVPVVFIPSPFSAPQ